MYAPLAVASLADMISAYQPDFPAKLTLLTDYLNGLSYLHDQKSVMHRDINPSNLAVVSFGNPKGIILDLDSATPSPTSTDHMKGTLQYLAPEIMDWKNWNNVGQQPAPYGKSVDVWALGLSMFALYHGQPLRWASLVPRAEAPSTVSATVTRELHTEFHRRVRLRRASCLDPQAARFLEWIEQMTEYFPGDRISASEVLDLVLEAPKDRGKGSIVLKTGLKRPLEE